MTSRKWAWAVCSGGVELAFLHDTLVRLTSTLDSILIFPVTARKSAQHFVISCRRLAIGKTSAEVHLLADIVAVSRGLQRPRIAIHAEPSMHYPCYNMVEQRSCSPARKPAPAIERSVEAARTLAFELSGKLCKHRPQHANRYIAPRRTLREDPMPFKAELQARPPGARPDGTRPNR